MKYGEGLEDNMSTNEKKAVALSSVFASAAMTIGKFAVGFTTGSLGIISEGLHSLLDLGAAALTYMAVRVSDKPADLEHPLWSWKSRKRCGVGRNGPSFHHLYLDSL